MPYVMIGADGLDDLVEFEVEGEDFVFVSLPGTESIFPEGRMYTETKSIPANPLPPSIECHDFAASTPGTEIVNTETNSIPARPLPSGIECRDFAPSPSETETVQNARGNSNQDLIAILNAAIEAKSGTVANKKVIPTVEMVDLRGNKVRCVIEDVGGRPTFVNIATTSKTSDTTATAKTNNKAEDPVPVQPTTSKAIVNADMIKQIFEEDRRARQITVARAGKKSVRWAEPES
ncbi:hypothetical protein H2200_007850 [Cladophialophora chaetospira]|uniref:Uncharacterized protein n=1 Tax=Cladophialophora chaetospira TaxID=386627 RepID=A0AA38X6J4_9EURO|nr:hypothetical protein H2200_007850 [Cladophialophora chaetospira]